MIKSNSKTKIKTNRLALQEAIDWLKKKWKINIQKDLRINYWKEKKKNKKDKKNSNEFSSKKQAINNRKNDNIDLLAYKY